MKKLTLALAVAAVALGSTAANAYTVAVPTGGVLVPYAVHNGPLDTTAVGVTNHVADTVNADNITVYWSFFNKKSEKLADGEFPMTPGDFHGFSLHDLLAGQHLGTDGYLTLVVGTRTSQAVARPICDIPGVSQGSALSTAIQDVIPPVLLPFLNSPTNGCAIRPGEIPAISATAFQANAAVGDAEFVPVMPIVNSIDWAPNANLLSLDSDDLRHLIFGAGQERLLGLAEAIANELPPPLNPQDPDPRPTLNLVGQIVANFDVQMDLRYTEDADTSTQFVIWGTDQLDDPIAIGHAVQIYDDNQNRVSGRLICGDNKVTTELCVADVATALPTRPLAWENGFVRFPVYGRDGSIDLDLDNGTLDIQAPSEFMVGYSRVTSAFFGATQTLLGSHFVQDPLDTSIEVILNPTPLAP